MKKTLYLALLASLVAGGNVSGQPAVTGLQCEHLERPLGIDTSAPRLSWRMDDPRQGARQTYYRVRVGCDSAAVAQGDARVWDSGRIASADQLVRYEGRELKPFTRYWWQVSAGDLAGEELCSDVQWFETGMMDMARWQGAWIGDGHGRDHLPAPYFRKEFATAGKRIRSARAYIAVAGLYELYINGQRVGDHRLDPLYTRFDRRNLYVTHDVTPLLAGEGGINAVGVVLGNGWYNHQSLGVWDFHNAPWRNRPAFCLDLRITYEDGTVQVVPTDLSWRTGEGELRLNSIYTAEHRDARLAQPGWNAPGFDESAWRGVGYRAVPSQCVTAQAVRPIRHVQELRPQTVRRLDERTWLFDFGQNMAGVTELRLTGEAGTVVRVKHGERLGKDGRIDLSNIDVYYRGDRDREPFQTDIFTLSGGDDRFMAAFNYKGFRYAEVSADRPIALADTSLTARFMHSDVPQTGTVRSSSPLIDGLWRATNNAYLSNLMGYPTDCPQREKNGWTGDGHLAIETALYNFDGITVYEKWLADHRDEQQPNGVLPDIIPTGGWGYGTDNGLDWTSTIAIIPWQLYLFYGDSKPLADCYEAIKRYVDYVERTSTGHLTTWGRGDWVPVRTHSNKELTSSVYFYADARILAQAAALFGRTDDCARYTALAEDIRTAINAKFLDEAGATYAGGSQTELSVPLLWGVVPDTLRTKVADRLAAKVAEAGFHLDVGVLGAKAILNALCENGHFDTAYRVAVQDTYPSWGWWVVNGATTLLENWDLQAERDISDNHMMFGEIGGWFFKGLGGIYPDPAQPGFRHTWLRPHFPRDLKHFEAAHTAPAGKIVSRWEWKRGRVHYTVILPANTTATLIPPAGVKQDRPVELEAGRHEFVFSMK